jgi:predicted ester cyclase
MALHRDAVVMATVANKGTARSYFEEVVNRGDASVADAIFASKIQFHYPLGVLSGADAVKNYLAAVRTAFPDIHFTIADLVAEAIVLRPVGCLPVHRPDPSEERRPPARG